MEGWTFASFHDSIAPSPHFLTMARWHSCNVLYVGREARRLWQFHSGNDDFTLNREETRLPTEPLPAKVINKEWHNLWNRKLNIAWLPMDKVFLRVVQLPVSDFPETVSMVELQLEKLSPLPVAQIVWTFELLPQKSDGMQTAIVVIAARNFVEEFLGQLEGQGYLADQLEVPFIDQLLATKIEEDGVWLYPWTAGDSMSCLVAWCYGGVLRNLTLVHLPPSENSAHVLREQLAQMAWAGEVEGWLTSPPCWHLIADAEMAAVWEPMLRTDPDQRVEVVPPVNDSQLSALTARRVAAPAPRTNLLPPEFSARYHQRFIDRIWMRGLGALVLLYLAGVLVYFATLEYFKFNFRKVEREARARQTDYNEVQKVKARMEVLRDQLELQYAALECWKATAEFMPEELTLENLAFEKGQNLRLYGSATKGDQENVTKFIEDLKKATDKEKLLFSNVILQNLNTRGDNVVWTIVAELARTDLK